MTDNEIQSIDDHHETIIKLLEIPPHLVDDARQECWVSTLQGNNTTQHLQHWLKREKRHIYHND